MHKNNNKKNPIPFYILKCFSAATMRQKRLLFAFVGLTITVMLGTVIFGPTPISQLSSPADRLSVYRKKAVQNANETILPRLDWKTGEVKTVNRTVLWPHVESVSCRRIWEGDHKATQQALQVQRKMRRTVKTDSDYRNATWNCDRYIQDGGFNLASVSEEELSFPVAFSLLVYRDADQVERFLRAIYRPHNVYCIHVDLKSDNSYRSKIMMMASCLRNVFVSKVARDVKWGGFTNLEPELICMRQLWQQEVKWRYFINLTGQEFALKTNKELVRILKAFQGANGIEGHSNANIGRWKKWLPAPYNLTVFKGGVHIVVSRGYVDYVLHSKVGEALLEWVKPTGHPDESFFNTLNHNVQLGVPGSTTLNHTKNPYPDFNRYKIWYDRSRCSGTLVRKICHFGVGDLPRLTSSPQLFANKFTYHYQPLAYDCLEEWYFHKVHLEEAGAPWPLNQSLYANSDMVKNRYTGPVKIW